MPASKRKAENSKSTARAAKVAKTAKTAASKGAKKGKPMSAASFKERAKPLHIVLTQLDSEPIGELDLTPSSFSTGSFGWKGSKKVVVDVPDADGEKSSVQVILTINATIAGSKGGGHLKEHDAEASTEGEE